VRLIGPEVAAFDSEQDPQRRREGANGRPHHDGPLPDVVRYLQEPTGQGGELVPKERSDRGLSEHHEGAGDESVSSGATGICRPQHLLAQRGIQVLPEKEYSC
jgi:hypothetical protein